MKIVIDTEKLQTTPYYAKNCVVTMEDIIKCGTILPKGHGRLIDADVVDDNIYDLARNMDLNYEQISEVVDKAPTIIEADKESDTDV